MNNYFNYPDELVKVVKEIADSFISEKESDIEVSKFSNEIIEQAVYDIWAQKIFDRWIQEGTLEISLTEKEFEEDIAIILTQMHIISLEAKGLVALSEDRQSVQITKAGEEVAKNLISNITGSLV